MAVTSSEITLKLEALDRLTADLGAEFDDAAALAVDGDTQSAKLASDIDARLTRLSTDRRILDRALQRARDAEAADMEDKAAAVRRQHFEAARDHAARLLEIAGKVDAAIAVLADALPALGDAERAVKMALGRARVPLQGASAWQSGIALVAADKVAAINDGRFRMQGPGRSISDMASLAWEFLNDEGGTQ